METATDIKPKQSVACPAGNFMFDPATHPDFLGACLGTGVDRSKVGDIILQGEQGAQILVVPNLVPFLETSLIQVWRFL